MSQMPLSFKHPIWNSRLKKLEFWKSSHNCIVYKHMGPWLHKLPDLINWSSCFLDVLNVPNYQILEVNLLNPHLFSKTLITAFWCCQDIDEDIDIRSQHRSVKAWSHTASPMEAQAPGRGGGVSVVVLFVVVFVLPCLRNKLSQLGTYLFKQDVGNDGPWMTRWWLFSPLLGEMIQFD